MQGFVDKGGFEQLVKVFLELSGGELKSNLNCKTLNSLLCMINLMLQNEKITVPEPKDSSQAQKLV